MLLATDIIMLDSPVFEKIRRVLSFFFLPAMAFEWVGKRTLIYPFFFYYSLSFYALPGSFLFFSVYILLFTLQLPCMNGDPDVSGGGDIHRT